MAAKLSWIPGAEIDTKSQKETNVAILLKERQQSDGSEQSRTSPSLIEILGRG